MLHNVRSYVHFQMQANECNNNNSSTPLLTWPNATSHDEAITCIQHTHKYKIFTYKASSSSSSHPPLSLYKRVPKHLTVLLPFKTRIATHTNTHTNRRKKTPHNCNNTVFKATTHTHTLSVRLDRERVCALACLLASRWSSSSWIHLWANLEKNACFGFYKSTARENLLRTSKILQKSAQRDKALLPESTRIPPSSPCRLCVSLPLYLCTSPLCLSSVSSSPSPLSLSPLFLRPRLRPSVPRSLSPVCQQQQQH